VHATWDSVVSKTLARNHKYYVQFKIENASNEGYIMLGFWMDDTENLKLALTQHPGQDTSNGGFGYCLHGNILMHHGDGRGHLVIPQCLLLMKGVLSECYSTWTQRVLDSAASRYTGAMMRVLQPFAIAAYW
jgi:hypothetical protein